MSMYYLVEMIDHMGQFDCLVLEAAQGPLIDAIENSLLPTEELDVSVVYL